MFNKKELSQALGTSDKRFKNNFDNVLTTLRTKESPRRAWRLHQTVAVFLIICTIFTGTVYGMVQIFVERADVGASWVLISAPEDYYESVDSILLRTIYNADLSADEQPRIDATTAQILQELLKGKVFTATNEAVETMTLITDSDEFCLNIGDGALYNEAGEKLREIRYQTVGYSEPQEIWMQTIAEYETQREAERQGVRGIKLTNDYEEATQLLGVKFRLPKVYIEEFEAPEFRYQQEDSSLQAGRKAVYVTYRGVPGIYYFAEIARNEDEIPSEWYAAGATIEQCEIKGTAVYKATSKDIIRYTWTYDGIVYMIFQGYSSYEFSDEQFVEIITSMIR